METPQNNVGSIKFEKPRREDKESKVEKVSSKAAVIQVASSSSNLPDPTVDNKDLDKMCRICYSGETKKKKLITPCLCSGSTKYTHEKCLLDWFSVKQSNKCELCLYPIQVNRTGIKPLWKVRAVSNFHLTNKRTVKNI